MPTTYTDQFWVMDPAYPPVPGSTLNVQVYDIIDNNNNGLVNRFSNDRVDGSDIRSSYPGDRVTVQLSDGSIVTVEGITFYLRDGREVFTPTDGTVLEDAIFISSTYVTTQGSLDVGDLGPTCFTRGALIETPDGPRAVETLKAGDKVLRPDGTALEIRMALSRSYGPRELKANPKLKPIRIRAGALGRDLPWRDLVVSRQHRMLVSSKIAARMFGEPDVLIPAIRLTELPGIEVEEEAQEVEYFHLLFDRHELLVAEGAPTESLYTGAEALKSLGDEALEEIFTIFPELAEVGTMPPSALPLPPGKQQKQLIARHAKNGKPLLENYAA